MEYEYPEDKPIAESTVSLSDLHKREKGKSEWICDIEKIYYKYDDDVF
jgi:hypothetical protein